MAGERERPDRNLALDIVRVTEAAALAASRWVGAGDKGIEADESRESFAFSRPVSLARPSRRKYSCDELEEVTKCP